MDDAEEVKAYRMNGVLFDTKIKAMYHKHETDLKALFKSANCLQTIGNILEDREFRLRLMKVCNEIEKYDYSNLA